MNYYSDKMASSSLALVEKRNQRAGGCVGIFSQLFDWNRRFAKKRLFPKKLLPPVSLEKASKMFERNEKQPKLRLIADENSGGFPSMKNNGGNCHVNSETEREMQVPGLIARLMGLESLPALQKDKLKKAPVSEKHVDKNDVLEGGELCAKEAETKNESRPQKLQKTGLSDKRPVSKLEVEALQLKNVLSRSRKHNHKLESPVRNPGNLSSKRTSRLVGAATKILEPGLQKNRSNCAIGYTNSVHNPKTKGFIQGASEYSKNLPKNLHGKSSSCRSYDCSLDVKDFTPNPEGPQQINSSRSMDHSSEVCESRNPGVPVSLSMEHEQPYAEIMIKQMCSDKECLRQQKDTSLENNIRKGGPSFHAQGERQMFKGRKNIPSRSKLSKLQRERGPSVVNETNDARSSVALDRYITGHARPRVSGKMECCELDVNRNVGHNATPSLSHVRKRRSDNISGKMEDPAFVDSNFSRSSYIRSSLISERDTNGSCHSHDLKQPQESASYCIGESQILDISSSFNSQIKQQDTCFHAELDEKVHNSGHDFSSKRSAPHEDGGKENKHGYFPLDNDSLGALLQEKLRELTSHEEENESAFEDTSSRKTVAVILQELISALTRGKPCHQDYVDDEPPKNLSYFQDRVQSKVNSFTASQERERFSPGSVLDGTFSNDSFVSSSLDESSNSCEETVMLEPDADLMVSATSSSNGMLFRESITFLTRHISEALSSIDFTNVLLNGIKLVHAKEIILNAETVFGNSAIPDITLNKGFSICKFVQNDLETLVTRFHGLMGTTSTNTFENRHHQLKGLVFDCVIEYLESRFSRYSNTGFNVWSRLPLRMKTEMLTCEIVEEVGRWIYMSGLSPTELLDYEMSYKLGKWTDFDLEAFETGAEVDHLILESLMDEIIVDVLGAAEEIQSLNLI